MNKLVQSKSECTRKLQICCGQQSVELDSCINDYVKTCFCLLMCLGCLLSQAHVITGEVLDLNTNKPISNVNIFIENSNVGTMTNIEGKFSIYVNNIKSNNVNLNISMIGYEKKVINFNLLSPSIDLGMILLNPQSLELQSVHIHAHGDRFNQISDISLSGQDLNDNIRGNLAETLANQPNIGVNSFGVVTSKPVLRGYSGDRFLIVKDGSEIGDLSVSSIDHVITLDMNEVNEIEIIRGPKTMLYGSNAIGGVIRTSINGNPKVRVRKVRSKLTFGGESYNSGLYGNMIFYIPFGNNQLNLVASNRDTRTQTSPIRELQNTYSQTSNYKLGFTRYNKRGYLNFIFEDYSMDYGIPPSLEGHINGVDIKLTKQTFQFNYHRDLSLYNFNQFDIKYDYIDYEHREYENNKDYFSVSLAKKTHNMKMELFSNDLIIGSEINFKKFIPGGFFWTPRTDEYDISFYGFYEKNLNSFDLLSAFRIGKTSIQPEILWSFSNLNDEDVNIKSFNYSSSSIGIIKNINKFKLNSWIMYNMKVPRVEELYSDGPHLGTYAYEIGQPNLQIEEIYGMETSLAYNTTSLDISLTSFYNYSPYYYQMSKMGDCNGVFIKGESHPCAGADFIEWGSGAAGWLYKYDIQGIESVIKGIEFNFEYSFMNYNIVYDFSYVKGNNLTNDQPLSYINPTKEILQLSYAKDFKEIGLRFSNIHSQNRLGEFESYTPSALLVDIISSYTINNHNISIQFKNILNQIHYNHLSIIKDIMPEPGRNLLINYKIFF